MPEGLGLALALVILALTLGAAVTRAPYTSEAAMAAMGAVVLLLLGAIGLSQAGDALDSLAPTVGFLAAPLLIADGARREGLFEAIGALMESRSRNSAARLLALVVVTASAVTALLGLDATAVLLTPIVLVTARRMRTDPRPHLYATGHLGELGVAAAADLEPDEPARVPRGAAFLQPLRGADVPGDTRRRRR